VADAAPRCVLDVRARLGEGPLWHADERALYWLDHQAPALHRFDPASGLDRVLDLRLEGQLGGLALAASGDLILFKQDGLFRVDLAVERLAHWLDPEDGCADTCFNDGKVDRDGRLWVGSAHLAESEPRGSLWRIGPGGDCRRMVDGLVVANGPAFSPDGGTLYLADSPTGRIFAWDLDHASGALANRRMFAEVPPEHGLPDGMTVDAEGALWSCHWGGWRIKRYAPDGEVLGVVPFPVPQVTSCTFGGLELRTLFVTTAAVELDPETRREAPQAGGLFALETAVAGLPEPRFRG
jgi:sugar lactone lactonase YvrE